MLNQFSKQKILLFIIGLILLIFIAVNVFSDNNGHTALYYRLKEKGWIDTKENLSEIKGGKEVMVALAFGQSNAGNSGQSLYIPHNQILNYWSGKLFLAKDPLVGSGGRGGSVWGVVGDMLLDSGLFKKVVIVPIAMGSTSVSCWADSACHLKLIGTLKDLQDHHIKLTHIFWHQGEQDTATSTTVYKSQLAKILNMIRSYHQDAPFYCSIASIHGGVVNKPVNEAQLEFIKENKDVLYGPSTDQINEPGDRYQGVHFTAKGRDKYARLWFQAIKESKD